MNQHLQSILNFIQQDENLSANEKNALSKSLKEADKELEITTFKLDRTEKVKRTTAILLEETIMELEQKRKAVEAQNRELEIESSLERVRTAAMSMNKPDDMPGVCRIMSEQLEMLGIEEIRNVQTAIFYEGNGTYMNYEYYRLHDKALITEVDYRSDKMTAAFAAKMVKGPGEFFTESLTGKALKDWFEFQKTTPQFANSYLAEVVSLNYYWFSLGPIALGMSTYAPLSEEQIELFKRFRNVFDLAYRRFVDIELAIAQAKEAKIEASLERMRAAAMSMRKSEELITVCESMYRELMALGFTNIRNAQIAIKNDTKQSYLVSEFSDYNVTILEEAPYNSSPIVKELFDEMAKSKDALYQKEFSGKEFDDWRTWRMGISSSIDSRVAQATSMCFYLYSIGTGHLGISTFNSITKEQLEILKRFRNVFELSYRRYTDVAQAEAQAREAQIELALERVRARTMAMQKSEELQETSLLLFHQFKELGQTAAQISIGIIKEEEAVVELSATLHGNQLQQTYKVSIDEPFVMKKAYNAWKAQEKSAVLELAGKELHDYNIYRNKLSRIEFNKNERPGDRWIIHLAFFSKGMLSFSSNESHPTETIKLLERFAGVFDLTYTRFLDLKNAEVQAKEAKIEAALERVRAKAMAMHSSADLAETIKAFYHQMGLLNLMPRRCGVGLIDKETHIADLTGVVISEQGEVKEITGKLNLAEHPVLKNVYDNWLLQKEYHPVLRGNEIKEYYQIIGSRISFQNYPDDAVQFGYFFFFTEGCVYAWTEKELVEDELKIYRRFTTVLSLTYKRYKDLKLAEAQARQAQIETAMEKVRARALAMQKPEELIEVAQVLRKEMGLLGVEELETSSIYIHDETSGKTECWYAIKDNREPEKKLVADHMIMQLQETWVGREMLAFYKSEEKQISIPMQGANRKEWIEYCSNQSKILNGFYGENIPDRTYHLNKFSNGYIGAASPSNISAESWDLLQRATLVFSLGYTRFHDLQVAEAQAREAKIEAALERVRSKAMAMHSSEDLAEAIGVFYRELKLLSVTPRRCGVALIDKETRNVELSSMNTTGQGDSSEIIGKLKLAGHPVLEDIFDHWLMQKEYHTVLRGNEIKEYYQVLQPQISYPDYTNDVVQFGNYFMFKEGNVYSWTEKELEEEDLQIYRRFSTVLSLTYKRYKDLKDAEARTQIAIRQASLDRVRAEIASMRTAEDLQRITPSVWRELTELGVPFFRCGVFIINEKEEKVHIYLSTPDGKPLAVLHLDFESSGVTRNAVENWRFQKVYTEHWNREQFVKWVQSLIGQGQIKAANTYQAGDEPPESLTLQFVPFAQGMLYVGSAESLSASQVELVQALAEAFSVAYARYEDFKKLEEAKNTVETTLNELKAMQSQLIQSEKMASLGELTAGIAHEIQNPLNFVNNFSEVNTELIEEMKTELIAGNNEDAISIANDIADNEQKINHHGKRADAIVKGMLQHSRSSSGIKEPTDINALADEYLRLAYHGLRAKEKSFNATLQTDFDASIGNINIIPQDIGRVILNLITNAFYVVTEKKKIPQPPPVGGGVVYEPTVSVGTKKMGDKVLISVKDNGNGIPQKVLDKIFQPFFTTKPTGQGTGLGLSLSYDIIKAHGGEIRVETIEGEGAEFIIQLAAT